MQRHKFLGHRQQGAAILIIMAVMGMLATIFIVQSTQSGIKKDYWIRANLKEQSNQSNRSAVVSLLTYIEGERFFGKIDEFNTNPLSLDVSEQTTDSNKKKRVAATSTVSNDDWKFSPATNGNPPVMIFYHCLKEGYDDNKKCTNPSSKSYVQFYGVEDDKVNMTRKIKAEITNVSKPQDASDKPDDSALSVQTNSVKFFDIPLEGNNCNGYVVISDDGYLEHRHQGYKPGIAGTDTACNGKPWPNGGTSKPWGTAPATIDWNLSDKIGFEESGHSLTRTISFKDPPTDGTYKLRIHRWREKASHIRILFHWDKRVEWLKAWPSNSKDRKNWNISCDFTKFRQDPSTGEQILDPKYQCTWYTSPLTLDTCSGVYTTASDPCSTYKFQPL